MQRHEVALRQGRFKGAVTRPDRLGVRSFSQHYLHAKGARAVGHGITQRAGTHQG